MDQAPPNNSQHLQPVTLPESWPGATGLYKYSKQAINNNLGTVVLLILFSIALFIVISAIVHLLHLSTDARDIISNLVAIWITAASTVTYLACVRGQKIEPGEALSKGWHYYFNYLVMSIMVVVISSISLILLIVPFFFVFPRLTLAGLYVVDKDMNGFDAIKASWEATRGHAGKVWGILILTIAMAILVIVIIGIYFVIMYSAAMTLLYFFVTKERPATIPKSNT